MVFNLNDFEYEADDLVPPLGKKIINQDGALETLSVAVCNHYKRLKYQTSAALDLEVAKSVILLVGSTGVGKTYLARQIAKKIGVPFNYADATELSETGYVGKDVDSIVTDLILEFGENEAQYGLVMIDEFDKLAKRQNIIGHDISRDGVQRGLLTLLEGKTVKPVPPHHPQYPIAPSVSTENIFFVLTGAFEGLYELMHDEMKNTKGIGFGSDVRSKSEIERSVRSGVFKPNVQILEKYGFGKQVIGRISRICFLNDLDKNNLYEILKADKNPAVLSKTLEFEARGIDLEIEDDAFRYIAHQAHEMQTGARSLKSILDETFAPYQRHFKKMLGCGKFVLTEEMAKKPGIYKEKYFVKKLDTPEIVIEIEFNKYQYLKELEKYGVNSELAGSVTSFGLEKNLHPSEVLEVIKDRTNIIRDYETYFKAKFGPTLDFDESAVDYLLGESFKRDYTLETILYQKLGTYIEVSSIWEEKSGQEIVISRSTLISPKDMIPALRNKYKV